MKSNIDFKWEENEKKQKYDKIISEKIGFTANPFIKQLENKRNFQGYPKIGQPDIWSFLKAKKPISCKIGHEN